MPPKENQKSASDFDALDRRVAAPSVCFAVARILLAAAPTAPPCIRHWRRSSPLQERGCSPLSDPKEEGPKQKCWRFTHSRENLLTAFLLGADLRRCRRCYAILFGNAFFFTRHPEQHEAHDEQHDEGADAHIGAAGQLAPHADDHRPEEGCPLAADVEKPEVLARLLRRDDLCKVGAAEGLHAALEHPHDDGQHPELPLLGQKERKHRDARIGRDADRDELRRGILVGQPPEDEGRRERHDLRHQQGQQQPGGVQPQRRAVGRGHVDDGIHAVDVAEERQQEPEHLLVLRQMPQGLADAGKTLSHCVLFHLHIVELAVAFQQRQGGHEPPHRRQDKRDVQRRHLADANGPRPQHKAETDHEGDAAADVAPRIAPAGHLIHPLRRGHIPEHGVVEHQTARKSHLRNDEDDEEGQPRRRRAHGAASHDAHADAEHEDGLFEASGVRHRAEDRAEDGRDNGHDRAGIAPVGQILHRGQAAALCQCVEENGDKGRHHQHKGRVSHIVQDPVPFQPRQAKFAILSHPVLLSN